jgi:hypothetical protein
VVLFLPVMIALPDIAQKLYTHCVWAGRTFFPVMLLCQFFGCGREKILVLLRVPVVMLFQFFGWGGK